MTQYSGPQIFLSLLVSHRRSIPSLAMCPALHKKMARCRPLMRLLQVSIPLRQLALPVLALAYHLQCKNELQPLTGVTPVPITVLPDGTLPPLAEGPTGE